MRGEVGGGGAPLRPRACLQRGIRGEGRGVNTSEGTIRGRRRGIIIKSRAWNRCRPRSIETTNGKIRWSVESEDASMICLPWPSISAMTSVSPPPIPLPPSLPPPLPPHLAWPSISAVATPSSRCELSASAALPSSRACAWVCHNLNAATSAAADLDPAAAPSSRDCTSACHSLSAATSAPADLDPAAEGAAAEALLDDAAPARGAGMHDVGNVKVRVHKHDMPGNTVPVTILRYFIGGGEQPTSLWFRAENNQFL